MRPIRLELEGFTAFRESTTIDFEGVDTFVLTGPTGSGKSSVIDAITFALYGCVSRYNDTGLIYPIISQGMVETKVRFDFEINGQRYTAVRIVRKQKRNDLWGASTKEARLESGDKVLAGNANELDAQIRKLFGLDFEQFTSCVVLPQGQFARFLNSKPSERQDLLKELLRIQIYDEIGSLSRSKTQAAINTKKVYEEQHEDYAKVSATDKHEIEKSIGVLVQLRNEIDKIQKDLSKIEDALQGSNDEIDKNEELISHLKHVVPPKDYASIAKDHLDANKACETQEEILKTTHINLEKLEKKFEKLPDKSKQQEIVNYYLARSDEEQQLSICQKEFTTLQKQEKLLERTVNELTADYDKAKENVRLSEKIHLAFHLSQDLSKGQPCPICRRSLDSKPVHNLPKGLKDAESDEKKSKAKLDKTISEFKGVNSKALTLQERISAHTKRISQFDKNLKNAPTLSEVSAGLRLIEEVASKLRKVKDEEKNARQADKEARENRNKISQELSQRWKLFDKVRDSVGSLQPPSADKDNFADAWKTLSTWAITKKKELENKLTKLSNETAALNKKVNEGRKLMRRTCLNAGIELVDEDVDFRDVIVEAISDAKSKVKTIEESIKKQKALGQKIEKLTHDIAIGKSLSQHMGPQYFERWLLQEAFSNLVTDGSKKLYQLSSGDYSFALDDKLNFDIIDHRNADEKRSYRTLSGGETFLASLALALTLSEQIAELATDGSAQLESIFLDEGFGTLDPESLETVSNAIEELAARGRIIGLITHVKELADKIPVQYRVAKGATTATVEKVVL